MLSLPASTRIWLATRPTDLRKSFDTLAELVRQQLQNDPLSGQLFVFRNKRGDRIKLLHWDEDGFVIVYKRLEAGTFRFPQADCASLQIRAADLHMLLDGVDLDSVKSPAALSPACARLRPVPGPKQTLNFLRTPCWRPFLLMDRYLCGLALVLLEWRRHCRRPVPAADEHLGKRSLCTVERRRGGARFYESMSVGAGRAKTVTLWCH